jgi:hypothetical protein
MDAMGIPFLMHQTERNAVHQHPYDAPFDALDTRKYPEMHRNARKSGKQHRARN